MGVIVALFALASRRALGVLLAVAMGLLVVDQVRLGAARTRAAQADAALQTERAAAAKAAADLQATYRRTEQLREARIQEIQHESDQRLAALHDDAARAADAARRLRAQLAQLASTGRSGPTGAGVARRRTPAGDLAELLGACSERYRAVAASADQHHAAGLACEQSFDAVRGQ